MKYNNNYTHFILSYQSNIFGIIFALNLFFVILVNYRKYHYIYNIAINYSVAKIIK